MHIIRLHSGGVHFRTPKLNTYNNLLVFLSNSAILNIKEMVL